MAFAYAEKNTWSGRQWGALVGAVAVNVGFLAAISSGLTFEVPSFAEPARIIATIFDEPKPEPVTAPTPEVQQPVIDQTLEVPMPEVPIEIDTPPPIAAEVMPVEAAPVTQPAPPATQLQADRQLSPPVYPPTSRRLGEEGTVRLMIYVSGRRSRR